MDANFFDYFAEQQKAARVIGQALAAEGLPQDMLIAQNLTLLWVVSQPIDDGSRDVLQRQLGTFLAGSEAQSSDERSQRARVRRDFSHSAWSLPFATQDSTHWRELDQVEDSFLSKKYLQAISELRGTIDTRLRVSRSWEPKVTSLPPC